ncbi:hypothetical protein OG399_45500 [Streptomyces achromogenes]
MTDRSEPQLDAGDVDEFVNLLRNGLIEAPADHETTQQDNFALRAETSEKLSRPVLNGHGEVVEELGDGLLRGTRRVRQA